MANAGDRVRIHYTGRLDDGTVFDTSDGRDPLEFVVGAQQVIAGLDREILEMSEGEAKTVTVAPEDAYGQPQENMATEVQRSALPESVGEGDAVKAQIEGREVILWVSEITEDSAVVDANHPLAGKTLTFDIELVEVQPAA